MLLYSGFLKKSKKKVNYFWQLLVLFYFLPIIINVNDKKQVYKNTILRGENNDYTKQKHKKSKVIH